MTVTINGETKTFEDNTTLQAILSALNLEDKVMAIAVNMQIVKQDKWQEFVPCDKDSIEMLHFVGGG